MGESSRARRAGRTTAFLDRLKGQAKRVKKDLDFHATFWIVLAGGTAIFVLVPQVANVWQQAGPAGGGLILYGLYIVFVAFIASFYLLSLFILLRPFPLRWFQERCEERIRVAQDSKRKTTRTIVDVLLVPPGRCVDFLCSWLIRFSTRRVSPELTPYTRTPLSVPKRRAPMVGWPLLVIGLVVVAWAGAAAESSYLYPLAGSFCRTTAVIALITGFWLTRPSRWLLRRSNADAPLGTVEVYAGRILAWLAVATAGGELLWSIPATSLLGGYVSFRLYTIWAAVHLLWSLAILALFIDRWHLLSRIPLRPIAIAAVVGTALWAARPHDVPRAGSSNAGAIGAISPAETREPLAAESWLARLHDRIGAIEPGPIVFVAASGGGSRAAIFTALALEALGRTPLDRDANMIASLAPDAPRTWGDNIALVSSVSGGSLASAYFVHRRALGESLGTVQDLAHTTKGELVYRSRANLAMRLDDFIWRNARVEGIGERSLPAVLARVEQARTALASLRKEEVGSQDELPRETLDEIERAVATLETLEQYLALLAAVEYLDRVDNDHPLSAPGGRAHGERLAWVLESAFFDAMCTDFMAPVMRGVLTYSLDRGDALARFWAERYEWRGSTNVAGYARRGELKSAVDYDESTPLLILNATDVGAGTRLAIGFPPLHDTLAHGSLAEARGGRSLSEVDETFAIDLSHAVKLSACFPWGFSVSRLRLEQSAARGDRDPDGARSPDSIRVLDGGVVDNTGIDSIYLIFKSLEELAAGRSGGDSDQKLAREILASLREKGVVIVEVDSGAKPVERELAWYSGPVAPIQGLSNAGHTNADRAKRFYIREVQRIVRESLSHDIRAIAPDDPMPEVCELEMAPNVVLHVPLQCNHYKPGEETPQSDVMTAWALGPFDKAEIVGRFLIEVALWDDTRRVISARLSTFLAWHAESSERLLGLARARLWGEVAKANAEPSGDAEGAREPTTKKLFEESTLQMDPSASASGWLQKDPEVERLWQSATDTAQSGRTLLERLKEAKPDEKERLERELATTRRVAQEQLKKLAEAVEERAQTASPPPTAQTDAKLLEYRLRVRERTARENFGSPKAAR